ncbi:MAG: hypothetical protein II904_00795, partial [Oscillospiraceae bacterium]|nr:hypothetical protein [Oscillospiraceae bacterium]
MTKSQANSYGGVRKKLMGAVAMLLVASIMVVSSTYAWFTLSTAPEITGISTSVGANGNLEIALLNSDTAGDLTSITSAVGDSADATGRTVKEANVTWGNLVDLSDSSYGTGSFVLNPARLNANADTQTLDATNILLTAKYGNDGRVSELAANTVSGTYSTEKASFVDSGVGVRGIGVAAAMTAEQLALRNAVAQVALNTNNAKVGISNALTSNGSKLASLAMSYANATEEAPYTPNAGDITAVNSVGVSVSNAKNLLGNAIRYAMMAEALSKSSEASKDYEDYALTSTDGYSASIVAAVEKLNAIPTVAEANDDNLKTVLDTLIDTNTMTINGFTTAQTRDESKVNELVSAVMSAGGLNVVLPSAGASAFARVADMTGNFSANITIETLSYGAIALTNVKASMATAASGASAMATVGSAIAGLSAAASTTVNPGDTVITDMYGYAVDFAVRTNAAGSNLLLQVEEAQRIYSDGDNVSTQGGGSYMQFTKGSDLNETQFRNLLGAIRVVFTDGSSNIKMVAVLDVNAAVAAAGENASISDAKIRLLPVAYSIAAATGDTAGKLTVGDALTGENANAIMQLEQNTAAKVTATVYLDGDIVDNSMVSATSARSMTGTMNLQFASSAALVPMDY